MPFSIYNPASPHPYFLYHVCHITESVSKPWKLEIAAPIFGISVLNAVPVGSVKYDTLQKIKNQENTEVMFELMINMFP